MPETLPSATALPPKGYVGRHKRLDVRSSSRGHKEHLEHAKDANLFLPEWSEVGPEAMAKNRNYRELMLHDGTRTYLVHSTTPEKARQIMQEGLEVLGSADDPKLEQTVVMLSGPDDPDQLANNAFNLSYQYNHYLDSSDNPNTAKVIFEIPKPTPDIRLSRHPFGGTHLAQADGVHIVNQGKAERPAGPDDTIYEIPADRAMGFIDQNSSELPWHANVNFAPQKPELAPRFIGATALHSSAGGRHP